MKKARNDHVKGFLVFKFGTKFYSKIKYNFGGKLPISAIVIREIMHSMWTPKSYKYVYLTTMGYVMTITMPHCVILYWAFGDELLTHSNAFSVLPASTFRSMGLGFMIAHQVRRYNM